jgi:hypothetical protein
MRTTLALLMMAALSTPAAAQARRPAPRGPALQVRPFFLVSGERFRADTTFDALFGESVQPFWGGGVEVDFRQGWFVELSISRMSATGERAFVNNGQIFPLGIPLEVSLVPIEVAGGFRMKLARHPGIIPYVNGGIGFYGYRETSPYGDAADEVDRNHVGALVSGGAEFRLHRWIGAAVDVRFNTVPGILGSGGLSGSAGETNLGGIAARGRILIGR